VRGTPSSTRQGFAAFVVVIAGLSTPAGAARIAPSPPPQPPKADITIARDTTYFLGPVNPDGTIDYATALDAVDGKGVRPDDNAAVPLFEAFGAPKSMGDMWKRLGTASLAPSGPYFAVPDPILQGEVLLKARKAPWAAGEHPRVHAWLAANDAPLARVVEATRRPRLWFPRPSGLPIGGPAPFFNEMRWAAEALSARAMLRLRAGDSGAAWTDVLAIHRLAALQARDGRLFSWVLARGNKATADGTAAIAITHDGKPFGGSAKARLADLAAISPFPASAEMADRVLRAETLDLVSRFAAARSAAELKGLDMPPLAWERVDWNVVLRAVNGRIDGLVAIARRPMGPNRRRALQLWAQQGEAAGAAARKTLAPVATKSAGRGASSRAVGDILSSQFIDGSFVTADEYGQIRGDLNRLALALAAHRADNGRYPASLAELAPRFFAGILPRDPFTGTTPVYERQGGGYLLYSPGLDQKFDRERGGSGDDVVLRVR
jgi:hypothetical protein